MTPADRNAIDALTRRVRHAASIPSLIADRDTDDPDVGMAFDGIATILHETVGKLYELTEDGATAS